MARPETNKSLQTCLAFPDTGSVVRSSEADLTQSEDIPCRLKELLDGDREECFFDHLI